MTVIPPLSLPRRQAFGLLLALWLPATLPTQVCAHGSQVGALLIEHPFAPPTAAGAQVAAVYFRALENRGEQADRLIAARCARAAQTELHQSLRDGDVMRMRAVAAIELPAHSRQRPMPGGSWHVMLRGLDAPLRVGDRFALTLRFERAGEREVEVWVQQPRRAGLASPEHAHEHAKDAQNAPGASR